jgi:hypothetical protein
LQTGTGTHASCIARENPAKEEEVAVAAAAAAAVVVMAAAAVVVICPFHCLGDNWLLGCTHLSFSFQSKGVLRGSHAFDSKSAGHTR